MMDRIIAKNEKFELTEIRVRAQNSGKLRRVWRIRKCGWTTGANIQRMNEIVSRPGVRAGYAMRFRSRQRAEQAFVMLTLAWR